MNLKAGFSGLIDGNQMVGKAKPDRMNSLPFTGAKEQQGEVESIATLKGPRCLRRLLPGNMTRRFVVT
jgi:hypothetical protein